MKMTSISETCAGDQTSIRSMRRMIKPNAAMPMKQWAAT
jgi:hypothetical protein